VVRERHLKKAANREQDKGQLRGACVLTDCAKFASALGRWRERSPASSFVLFAVEPLRWVLGEENAKKGSRPAAVRRNPSEVQRSEFARKEETRRSVRAFAIPRKADARLSDVRADARAEWEKVKAKRGTTRKRQAKDGNKSIFSGFLVCADCGSNLNYHFNQKNPDIKYFNCANNNNHGDCPTNHYIRLDFLEEVVLAEMRRLTAFARDYEDKFAKAVMGHSTKVVELEYERKQRELKSLLTRDGELDALFERIYEDNLNGKLTDERYAKMAKRYETEQTTIAERVKILKAELRKADTRMMTSEMFVSTVRRYADAKTLTQRMISELIDRIEVFQAEKVDGEHKQRLRIHYNGVDVFDIPDEGEPQIRMQTRRGVVVTYEPERKAV
jgi:hypothetical protein